MYACMKEHVHLLSQNWSFACGRQREQIWLRLARKYYVNTYQKHMHNSALSHVGAIKNRPIARRNTSIRVRVNVSDLKMPFRSGSMFFFHSYSFSLLILDVSLFSYVQHAWQRIHCLFYYSHTHTRSTSWSMNRFDCRQSKTHHCLSAALPVSHHFASTPSKLSLANVFATSATTQNEDAKSISGKHKQIASWRRRSLSPSLSLLSNTHKLCMWKLPKGTDWMEWGLR